MNEPFNHALVKAILSGDAKGTVENVPATAGGCWYCGKVDEHLTFSTEFDTFVHVDCTKKAIAADPRDIEAMTIGEELGLVLRVPLPIPIIRRLWQMADDACSRGDDESAFWSAVEGATGEALSTLQTMDEPGDDE
jgi:hypothetical protein